MRAFVEDFVDPAPNRPI